MRDGIRAMLSCSKHSPVKQTMETRLGEPAWNIIGLAAEGPFHETRDKLALFGQFVGDWDILEDRYLRPDGTWAIGRGELHWRWILDGKALQDVWSFTEAKTGDPIPEGTTVRFYDSRIDAWHSVWISPNQGVVKTFIARKVGDEIVLDGKSTDGYPVKWIFSEISRDAFRWRSEETRDDRKTWTTKEEMSIRRRKLTLSSAEK